jgi:hypothetical protein
MAEAAAPSEPNAEASGPAAPTGPNVPEVGPAGSAEGVERTQGRPDRGCPPPPAPGPAEVTASFSRHGLAREWDAIHDRHCPRLKAGILVSAIVTCRGRSLACDRGIVAWRSGGARRCARILRRSRPAAGDRCGRCAPGVR